MSDCGAEASGRRPGSRIAPARRALLLVLVLAAAACARRGHEGLFRNVTRASGIDFRWRSDLVEAKLVATMGGGVALGDYDNDGHLDVFLPNSVRRYRALSNGDNCGKLYRGRDD